MSEMEEGKVLQRYITRYGLSQRQISDKVGKSDNWVRRRIALVLKIIKDVQDALSKNLISSEHVNFLLEGKAISNLSRD